MAEDADLDDAEELERIFRFATRSGPRFGLALALYVDPALAREHRVRLLERIRARGRGAVIAEFQHDDDRQDLVQRLAGASAGTDVLFVVGLDRLVLDHQGRTRWTSAIANLNQRRDELPRLLDARIVFWIAEAAYSSLLEVAQDLCQVMLTTAEFRDVRSARPDPLRLAPHLHPSSPPRRADPASKPQVDALVQIYEHSQDPHTRADAAASTADIYLEHAQNDLATKWLKRAATAYDEAGRDEDAARQHLCAADIARSNYRFHDALILAHLAIESADRAGATREKARGWAIVADIAIAQSDFAIAQQTLHEKVLPLFEAIDDERGSLIARGRIADVLFAQGDLERAMKIRREEELPAYKRLGDKLGQAITLGKIADILTLQGRLDESLHIHTQEAMPIYEEIGATRERAITTAKVADILRIRGELDDALNILRHEALPVLEDIQDLHGSTVIWGKIADIEAAKGDLDAALRIHVDLELPGYERLGDIRGQAVTLGNIADILQARGDPDEAVRLREMQVLPTYEKIGDLRSLAIGRANLAVNLLFRGHPGDAERAREILALAAHDAKQAGLREAEAIERLQLQLIKPPE